MTKELKPLKLIETTPGKYSLLLNAGTTAVDDKIQALHHEPNGYFWEGVAQLLLRLEAPELEGRFNFEPEAGKVLVAARHCGERRAADRGSRATRRRARFRV